MYNNLSCKLQYSGKQGFLLGRRRCLTKRRLFTAEWFAAQELLVLWASAGWGACVLIPQVRRAAWVLMLTPESAPWCKWGAERWALCWRKLQLALMQPPSPALPSWTCCQLWSLGQADRGLPPHRWEPTSGLRKLPAWGVGFCLSLRMGTDREC